MSDRIRAGVIGVGHIGKNHARLYAESEIGELAAVYDTHDGVAGQIAKKHGTRAVDSLEEFMESVDIASVATPTPFHHEIGMKLLRAGKHVLIEKPIAETSGQARELVECAAASGLILQVGHVERFNPVLSELERHLTHPAFIESHRLSPYPDRSTDIGVVMDLMIHDLEIILHLVRSPVSSIDAVGIPVLSRGEDIANARLRFESGCVANVTVSRISPEKMRKIRVFQEDAYLSLDYGDQSGEIYRKQEGRITRDKVKIDKAEPLKQQLEAFMRCAVDGTEPRVSGYQATAALDLALRITDMLVDQNVQRG